MEIFSTSCSFKILELFRACLGVLHFKKICSTPQTPLHYSAPLHHFFFSSCLGEFHSLNPISPVLSTPLAQYASSSQLGSSKLLSLPRRLHLLGNLLPQTTLICPSSPESSIRGQRCRGVEARLGGCWWQRAPTG